jgi:hypothetical protein
MAAEKRNLQHLRFRSAATGLGLTLSLMAALAGLQITFARSILEATEIGLNLNVDAWAVPAFRRQLAALYGKAAFLLVGYWLLTAIMGRGRLLQIRSANIALVIAALIWVFVIVTASIVPNLHGVLKGVCPFLGISDNTPEYCFDCVSACDVYVRTALEVVGFVLPATLLAVSAVLRIVGSRRRWSANRPTEAEPRH